MDDALAREAREQGISKAELIRRRLARDGSVDQPDNDAAALLIGAYEGSPDDSTSVNRVVYGL